MIWSENREMSAVHREYLAQIQAFGHCHNGAVNEVNAVVGILF